MPVRPPTEDARKRSDKDRRFWRQCAFCQRWFKHHDNDVRVCGALLSPPQARCMLADDFGTRWWPKNKPTPSLLTLQRFYDEQHAAAVRG
jgi:hypothetical protein